MPNSYLNYLSCLSWPYMVFSKTTGSYVICAWDVNQPQLFVFIFHPALPFFIDKTSLNAHLFLNCISA